MAKRASEAVDKPLTAACRVVLLCGKEYFLRTLYTQRLRDLLAKEFGEIDTLNFDGSNCSAADVLDECRSFGLIAQHKLVAVDNAADLVKEEVRTMFENYCKSPSEGATLVLRSDTWRPGNLDKIIESVGVIKACEPLSDSMAMGWAQKRVAERYDAKIDGSAVQLLISRIGTDLSKIDTELAKLAVAAGAGATISPQLVSQFVGVSREEEIWGIQRTLLGGNAEESLQHLRYILDVSREPPVRVMWALSDLARKLHGFCRGMKNGHNPEAVARSLKVWGPAKDPLINAARRLPPSRALKLFETCVEADLRQKSSLGDQDRTLERVVIEFSEALSGR
ncbi:MAG: DNA polymerase III subunit delta [Phycisphaerales bacterium]